MACLIKKRNSIFGRYPSCDRANNALRFLLLGFEDEAFKEIVYAISQSGGYFHEDIANAVKEKMGW